jgi:hypothetical protein
MVWYIVFRTYMASSRNRQMINVLHNEIQEKKRKAPQKF